MVRVRIELTAFALSASHSAHWPNGPDKIVKNAEAWYHADGGGYFPPQKAEEDNTLHYLHNSTNIADFNIVAIIHLKHFQAHTVFTRISVNKTFVCPLTVAERKFFGQNGWSCNSAISTWRRSILFQSFIFTISVHRKII